ncbi:hypothetical protein E2C01_046442 [Portunus trituberculatus]|uniref:Uncharacterized protein n=1 Tax=Portunus trituberculatus TaxID=210409 RepID=A0A5B7FYG4_PORTR|nr:hypothetical protein [Portunus trituberculatus]
MYSEPYSSLWIYKTNPEAMIVVTGRVREASLADADLVEGENLLTSIYLTTLTGVDLIGKSIVHSSPLPGVALASKRGLDVLGIAFLDGC